MTHAPLKRDCYETGAKVQPARGSKRKCKKGAAVYHGQCLHSRYRLVAGSSDRKKADAISLFRRCQVDVLGSGVDYCASTSSVSAKVRMPVDCESHFQNLNLNLI
jgi:hypothetical protein